MDQPIDPLTEPLSGFTDVHRLVAADPATVGLTATALERGWSEVVGFTAALPGEEHPRYGGAVLSYGHRGHVVLRRATGYARRWADTATLLPRPEWIETRTDTIHDMASVSKLFTSIVVMQQVEAGRLDLDRPVADHLPRFAANDKAGVTVRMLLTHTSGFTWWLPLYRDHPTVEDRIAAVLAAPVTSAPGSTYLYSDLNLITLGVLCEHVAGRPLDRLVADGITTPLGMGDTGYNPSPAVRHRVAATEHQAECGRGMVWGEVHDENAWSLGGISGHAGIFSTARDMEVLAQTILNGGWYGDARILTEESLTAMVTNHNAGFPGDDHGLGFEIDQPRYMGRLASPRTVGHTGFTGTSLVIDRNSASFVILLTNRVHPSRSWGSVHPARQAAADGLADALAITPYHR